MPADLDLKPYRDEHDFELIQRMQKALSTHGLRKGEDAAALRKAVSQYAANMKTERRERAAAKARKVRTKEKIIVWTFRSVVLTIRPDDVTQVNDNRRC